MICIPLKKKSFKSLSPLFIEVQKVGDLTEIWFDQMELNEEELKKFLKNRKKPIIYKYEGKKKNLNLILKNKIEYIDIDFNNKKSLIREIKEINPKVNIIMSFHDFKKTPKTKELKEIAKKMKQKGADIIKIAAKAKTFTDSLLMLEFLSEISKKSRAICLCMGKEGILTRATGHLFGNYLMYAPIKKSDKTAEGQLTVEELKEFINLIK